MIFELKVYDNFHYMDETKAHNEGGFNSYEEALVRAKKIVEDSLISQWREGMTVEELLKAYKSFGEDPAITPTPEGKDSFSAWSYAQEIAGDVLKKLNPH